MLHVTRHAVTRYQERVGTRPVDEISDHLTRPLRTTNPVQGGHAMTAVTAPKRTCDTGMVRPYRPCPADFRDRFLEMGQSKEIEDHYRTNWRVIRRWISECGGDELRLERSKITGVPTKDRRSPARRFVMGQTLGRGK